MECYLTAQRAILPSYGFAWLPSSFKSLPFGEAVETAIEGRSGSKAAPLRLLLSRAVVGLSMCLAESAAFDTLIDFSDFTLFSCDMLAAVGPVLPLAKAAIAVLAAVYEPLTHGVWVFV